jgi:hypothetical protein
LTFHTDGLEKVRRELSLYEHPFFAMSAVEDGDGVRILVQSRITSVHTPEYRFTISRREIDHPQFRWSFQGLLYGSLNDYMVELFTRTPEGGSGDRQP